MKSYYTHFARLASFGGRCNMDPSYVAYLQGAGISPEDFARTPAEEKVLMRLKYEARKGW